MTKKVLFGLITITLIALVAVPLCSSSCVPARAPAKDKIVFGGARPISGLLSFWEESVYGPIYKMWVEEVNAKGGLYIEEYGKRLPIELKVYDDKSDMGTMTRLLEKLMVEDKVDFCLPPCSTAFHYAAAPIFNKHGYILMGAEGGATTITERLAGLPYVFMPLAYSNHFQMPVLADIFEEVGVKTVAIIFIEDLHGVEYSGVAVPELTLHGIDVKMVKSVPFGTEDLSPLLKEAKALDVDAFVSFTYPPETPTVVAQAVALGINFKAVLLGPGGSSVVTRDALGSEVMEGVMFEGAWNAKSSPAAAEFEEKFIARYGEGVIDYWLDLTLWGGLQFFEQAIEEAGTLDQSVIREIMATSTFDTCLGPTWFETVNSGGGLLAEECYAGQIGQWQSGVAEVIDPGEKRTAEPIYPKPDWPAP